jgi:ribonuclease HI
VGLKIWTDGACSPNPGDGGWGVVIEWPDGSVEELSGYVADTTNNRMELLAPIKALDYLTIRPWDITLYTDSMYPRLSMISG